MARVIQEHIKKPLADEVLFGKLKNGGHVARRRRQGRERPRQARLRVPRRPGDAEAGEAAGGAAEGQAARRRRARKAKRGSVPKVPLIKA